MLSTFLIGTMTFFVLSWLHLKIRFVYCMLFGALISPTDPIAVLGIVKKAGAPKSLEVEISGESLFNDGIGVVVFIAMLDIAMGGREVSAGEISLLFLGRLWEAPFFILSRFISIGIPGSMFNLTKRFSGQSLKLMTWADCAEGSQSPLLSPCR